MNDEALTDDVVFDRLVDGELSTDERHRLLASLDDRPGGWRQCALAFLEAQSWRTDLKQMVRDTEATPSTVCVSAPLPVRAWAERGRRSWNLLPWAVAASVLMAFTLGLAMRQDGLSLRSAAPNPGDDVVVVPSPNSQPATATMTANKVDDALTFFVRDEAGEPRTVHVPLVDADTLDEKLGMKFQPGLSDAARDHLEQHGYDVQSKQRYAPLMLDNGRSMIVPVEDTRIVPVSSPIY